MNALENDRLQSYSTWLQGISAELRYWQKKLPKELPVGKAAFEFIFPVGKAAYGIYTKILETGCGPRGGICGQLLHGEKLQNLHCCDPLAPAYNELHKQLDYPVPVAIEFAFVERLTTQYASNHFDVVIMQNALDHSFDPIWAVLEMLSVLKPGGVMKLKHLENEAASEQYKGMHQWNITQDPANDLVIWNKYRKQDINILLKDIATVTVEKDPSPHRIHKGRNWIVATLKKLTDFSTEDINDPSSSSFASFGQFRPPFKAYGELIFTDLTLCKLANISFLNKFEEVRQLQKQAAHEKNLRNKLKRSVSWRITSPLRALGRLVKGNTKCI